MKSLRILSLILLFFTVFLAACQNWTAFSNQKQVDYPPFPTATAFVANDSSRDDVYSNSDYGISITIPKKITASTADDDSGVFQEYVLGEMEAFGWLFPSGMIAGETLEKVGQTVINNESSWLQDVTLIEDKEITLDDGGTAWYTQLTGFDPENDYTVELRLTTVINASQAITLEFYSLPEYLQPWNREMNKMRNSLTLFSPVVFGVPRNQVLFLEGSESTNARDYDPATTHHSGDYLIFEGLVTYNQELEVVPALAASWEVSTDGTIFTFHLQSDAVFHNGRPVTADDVVYSWQRAADPETNSETVMTYLGDVVGVKEMHEGQAETISGLKVIDEHTLQVTIDAPKPYFLYKLTYPTANIVDRENIESGKDWYKTPNGTGAYRLIRWDSMERMIYERFEDYYGTLPAIPMVVYTLYTGSEFRLYEEGKVDIAGVADYNAERVKDPTEPLNDELITGTSLCTSYIQFDVTQPPFDDLKVRQAFILAFDKSRYLDVVLNNTDVAAKGLYPPALPGYNLNLQGYGYDPERARQLITESKYGSTDAFPEIIFTSSGYGSYADSLVAAMSQMWQLNLGVTITVQNMEPDKMLEQGMVDEYGQLTSSGWCADYPDPENFADVLFHTGSEMNYGNYSNPALDKILETARVELNVDKRIALYQQAEQIIVDDAAALFLYHSSSYVVVKPYIKGYIIPPVSTYPLVRYLSIDQSAR